MTSFDFGPVMSSGTSAGTTCHDKPNLSFNQPHMLSWPPSLVSLFQK
jgi:hypothetical protein